MLLGVQLDDEMLLNRQIDVFLLGNAHDLGGGVVPIEVQPLGGLPEGVGLQILLELLHALGLVPEGDDHAGLHQEGGEAMESGFIRTKWNII